MPALVAGIHVFGRCTEEDLDGRDKPGHDSREALAPLRAKATFKNLSCYPHHPESGDAESDNRIERRARFRTGRECRCHLREHAVVNRAARRAHRKGPAGASRLSGPYSPSRPCGRLPRPLILRYAKTTPSRWLKCKLAMRNVSPTSAQSSTARRTSSCSTRSRSKRSSTRCCSDRRHWSSTRQRLLTIDWRPDRPARKNQERAALRASRLLRSLIEAPESQSQRVFATATDCARNAGRQQSRSNVLDCNPLRPLHKWFPERAPTRLSNHLTGHRRHLGALARTARIVKLVLARRTRLYRLLSQCTDAMS